MSDKNSRAEPEEVSALRASVPNAVLRKCPLCGGEATLFESQQDGLWKVQCGGCGLTTGPIFINNSDIQRETVVAVWNTREEPLMNNELTPTEVAAQQLLAAAKNMGAHNLSAGGLAAETRWALLMLLGAPVSTVAEYLRGNVASQRVERAANINFGELALAAVDGMAARAASGTLTEGGDAKQAPGDSLSGATGKAGDAQPGDSQ